MKDAQAPRWRSGDWFEGNVSLSSFRPQTHANTRAGSLTSHTPTVIIQLRHVQVAQERRQRRESKAWLKWERMTAGATIWCRGLTAACPLDWLIGLIWQQGKKRSLKGPKYLLFSSCLSPHLNPLSPTLLLLPLPGSLTHSPFQFLWISL